MPGLIAVLNAGSSSIKFAIYDMAGASGSEAILFRGKLEEIGLRSHLRIANAEGETVTDRHWPDGGLDHQAATREILQTVIGLLDGRQVMAIGHRVVHGGTLYSAPTRIDGGVMAALRRFIPLAPLHQPHNLAPIQAIAEAAPHLPQVACFDTAFHRGQEPCGPGLRPAAALRGRGCAALWLPRPVL